MEVAIRPLLHRDIPAVVALQRLCFPSPFPEEFLWTPAHLESHLERFAAGQFVAECAGEIVGSASSLILSQENWDAHHDWETTCGGFSFDNHDPEGRVLYCADISVSPRARRMGIARQLYGARQELVRQMGLRKMGTACRLPDFHASGLASLSEYAEAVVHEERADRTLSPLLRMGMRFVMVLEEYMDDEESGNAAALLEWEP